MRLLRLRISAFGPFADPVDLDFESLNDAGLFLLTGSNGAGKSSILDAVCFALYGAVPGERNAARRFRSDHAAAGEAPIVELEASFGAGTFRVVRTAAWERPKRRGSGTTPQQSTVSVSRRVDDGWQPVTNRLDEAGQLLTQLVGMTLTQFCQVVILPQGRFQAFLQSTATERQALLQQLFHTGRFQRVEAWLRDHRLALRRTSEEHESAIREVVSRISEVTGSPVDDETDDVLSWASDGRERLAGRLSSAGDRSRALAESELGARLALESGRDLAARATRWRAALAEQQELVARAGDIDALRRTIEAARRAAPVAVLAPLVRARVDELDEAEAAHSRAAERLPTILGESPADLEATLRSLRAGSARFEALAPRAEEAEALRAELARCTVEAEAIRARTEELGGSDLELVLAELASRREVVRAAGLELPGVQATIAEVRSRLEAHQEVRVLVAEHEVAVVELARATSLALDAKDAWLTLREARIEGMAAELAGVLAVGADCPVCGSADHPRPATAHAGAPDAEAERLAQRAVDDAKTAQHLHDLKARELATSLDRARSAAGETPADELRARLEDCEGRARDLTATLATEAALESELAAASRRREAELTDGQSLRERRAAVEARREHVGGRLAAVDGELAEALRDTPYSEVREARADLGTRTQAVEAARLTHQRLDAARRASTEARQARTTAALEAGFASVEESESALLPPSRLAARSQEVSRHDARLEAVTGLLADPELVGLDGVAPPDVPALAQVHATADDLLAEARADVEALSRRLTRLDTLLAELDARHEAWAPVRRDLDLATHLSAFCEGKAADNRWQIQLSAYVVAWRLSQVADAANLRLAVLTHGRYSLEHTDLRGAGERRGGMTLLVRDEWTGVTRDPVTLSGGETFVVALALALGLADVITAEAGGASLQTLFVDEGFGMLDATSLDLVMDTLDSLRESGRTVGVVSHVAEMRSRIPVQVQVHKPRDHGPSTVRVRI